MEIPSGTRWHIHCLIRRNTRIRRVIDPSDLKSANHPFARLPWQVQMFVVFYLRSSGYAATEEELELAAHIVERRIAHGPIDHRDLAVVIDRAFPCEKDE